MGGGGVIRAAGKVAGLGVHNSSLRGGFSAAGPVEQSLRNVSRPTSAAMSSTKVSGDDVAMNQKATVEMDWVFAGGEEDLVVESAEPVARVVFGGAPSLQEAKDAMSALKEALDEVFLSNIKTSAYEFGSPVAVGQVNGRPLLANSAFSGTNSCIAYDSNSESGSKHAMQAFKMLSESTAAQTVVASIASDPNVWDAVMQNKALVGLLQSEKASNVSQELVSSRIFTESCDSSSTVGEHHDSSIPGKSGDADKGFLHKVKDTVIVMANTVADYVKNLFSSPTENGSSAKADAGSNLLGTATAGSFLMLAVMAIMVVVLKRGV